MARPTLYSPDLIPQVKAMAAVGATHREMAEYLGVGERTLERWRAEHLDLAAEMLVGKDMADERVVQSLYRKATGYSFDTERVFCSDGQVTRVPVVEHVPPDTTACRFWLRNRKSKDWRDQHHVEHSGTVEGATGDLALRLGTTLASMAPKPAPKRRRLQ